MNSKISVIIPTRNGQATIARAVRSVLNQTLRPAEILIVSDHLSDVAADRENDQRLRAALHTQFPAELQDGTIRIIQGEAKGPGIARNLGVKNSMPTNDLVAFLDDDDSWSDNAKLAKQADYLANHPEIDAVGSEKTFFIDEQGNPIRTVTQPTDPVEVRRQMLSRNPLITSSVLMRKAAFIEFGGFKHMHLAEEYDLWLRMNRGRNRIANVPETSIQYTVRPGSASQKKKVRMAWTVFTLVFKNLPFYPNRFGMVHAKWPVFKKLLAEKLR